MQSKSNQISAGCQGSQGTSSYKSKVLDETWVIMGPDSPRASKCPRVSPCLLQAAVTSLQGLLARQMGIAADSIGENM